MRIARVPDPDRPALRGPLALQAILFLGLAAIIAGPAVWVVLDVAGLWITGSFAAVGLLLAWRRPRQVVGWLLVAFALAFETVGSTVPGSASQALDGDATGIRILAWITSSGVPLAFGTLIALAVLFPTGRFPTGRVGVVGRVAVATPIVFAIVMAFAPAGTVTFSDGVAVDIPLPLAVASDWPGWPVLQVGVIAAVLISLAAAIGTLFVRFRRARGPEREQYKWFLAALIATLGALVFGLLTSLVLGDTAWFAWLPAVLAYPLLPIAIGIAVLRYRLYEIDRLISRTIGWGLVTGILVVVFAGAVIGLQALLAPVTANDTLAVAGSTLLAAALFAPLRARVQRGVDRRFNRARVDAQRAIDAFGTRLRDEVDLARLHGTVLGATVAAVEPDGAALWLRGGR